MVNWALYDNGNVHIIDAFQSLTFLRFYLNQTEKPGVALTFKIQLIIYNQVK